MNTSVAPYLLDVLTEVCLLTRSKGIVCDALPAPCLAVAVAAEQVLADCVY